MGDFLIIIIIKLQLLVPLDAIARFISNI